MSDRGGDTQEDRRAHWPRTGDPPGATREPHYPGEGSQPLLPPGAQQEVAPAPLPFDLDELFERLCKQWKLARDHSNEWRQEAREDYDFVAGKQWSATDLKILKDQNRPAVTFNRINPMIRNVCGLEVGNRQEVHYLPREIGDAAVNELLTEAARWVRDECDAEDEESDAFWDVVVAGMGWTGTELDYDETPEGKVLIDKIDPLEMYWDSAARKKNLSDSRVMFRVKEDVPIDEARARYPDAQDSDLHAGWAKDTSPAEPHDADEAPFYRQNARESGDGPLDGRVRLVEAQWWQYETFWRMADPLTGQSEMIPDAKMEPLTQRLQMLGFAAPDAVKQRRRVYWRAVLGAKVLHVWPGPEEGGYTWKCMTGERDRNNGTWYGIVRAMIDPQRWANKWMSQSMHIMNTGAKGGVMFETGAVVDVQRFNEEWSSPDTAVEVADGALSAAKIQPRPITPVPQGLSDLLTLALSSIRDCTGINLELLGLVEHDQPGIVEYQRKQAGMTVLAGLFDAKRRYTKDQGRLLLWYITNFLSDGRLIRITGQDKAKYVPLLKQQGTAEYDVIVDETPTSPNAKERAWAALMQMMPFLSRMPVPAPVYMELLKYSPLPDSVTSKIAQIIEQTPPQQDPIAIAAQAQAELNKSKAKLTEAQTQKTMLDAQVGSQQVQAERQRTQLDAVKTALEAKEIEAKIENLRSAALVNLTKAGVTQQDAYTNQMFQILDMLDTLVGWHQGQQKLDQGAAGATA